MQEDGDEERIPPDQLRALNTCGHQGGEGGGGPLTHNRVPTARIQGLEGDPQIRQRTTQACDRGIEDEGGTPTHQRAQTAHSKRSEGGTPTIQRATPACS